MKKYIPFIVFVFLFTACSKKHEPTYSYISSDTKKHFYFKPGSYWIYRDSISGRTDSFYVRKSALLMLSGGANNIVETLNLEIVQKISDTTNKDSILWQYTFRYTSLILSYYNFSKNVSYNSTQYYPFKSSIEDTSYTTNGYNTTFGRYIDAFSLASNTFRDTWAFYEKDSNAKSMSDYYTLNYFMNDSVLLIKMRQNYSVTYAPTINEVWELQRWYIVK